MKDKIFTIIISILFIILIGGILISAIKSGYFYMFDNDEFHHSQLAYLIHNGAIPYKHIYMSVYPPYIHYILSIIYTFWHYTFDALFIMRSIMIMLFLIRILLLFLIVRLLLGKFSGFIAVLLYILSPWVIFSEMQIRMDNVMITVFLLGLLCAAYAWKTKKILFDAASGFFIVISLFILLKILPSAVTFFVISTIAVIIKRSWERLTAVWTGALIAALLMVLPFIIQGTYKEMIQENFIEAITSYSGVFEFPLPLGFFYQPRNPALYGLHGKPLTWIYVWLLYLVAGAGLLVSFQKIVQKTKNTLSSTPIHLILIGSFIGQLAFLFMAESVFIQHYITLNWLFAIYATYVAIHIYHILPQRVFKYIYIFLFTIAIVSLSKTSIEANNKRAEINSDSQKITQEYLWKLIPENEPVFPNILFRKLAYPIPHGHFIGNVPDVILNRLGSIPESIEKTDTKYIYIDTYTLDRIPYQTKEYILKNFTPSQGDPKLYLRTNKILPKP